MADADDRRESANLASRLRLPSLLDHYPRTAVMGSFAFLNGLLTIGILAAVAMLTDTPSLFPSLGPTAFLLFSTPMLASACPRNTIEGHLIGVLAGYLSLVLFGLTDAPATIEEGVSAQRVGAAALSLALTSGVMVWLQRPHPPARAVAARRAHGGGGADGGAGVRHQPRRRPGVPALVAGRPGGAARTAGRWRRGRPLPVTVDGTRAVSHHRL